jgi:hypothetical protein
LTSGPLEKYIFPSNPSETCNVYRWNNKLSKYFLKNLKKLSAATVFAAAKKGFIKTATFFLILLIHIQNYYQLLLKFLSILRHINGKL